MKLVPIKEFEDLYMISDTGQVWSIKSNRFKYLHPIKGGYKRASLHRDGIKKRYTVSRLVALHFLPNPKNFPCVNHIDGNPTNNVVSNLEWCSDGYNVLHGYAGGVNRKRVGKSKYRNVIWHKKTKRWNVHVKRDYRTHYVGSYKDEEKANRAAIEFREKIDKVYIKENTYH